MLWRALAGCSWLGRLVWPVRGPGRGRQKRPAASLHALQMEGVGSWHSTHALRLAGRGGARQHQEEVRKCSSCGSMGLRWQDLRHLFCRVCFGALSCAGVLHPCYVLGHAASRGVPGNNW